MMKKDPLRGKFVFFVTGNLHKFNEARQVLAEHEIAVAMLKIKTTEIQDDNIEKIAKTSALEAFEKSNLPLIVEDAGLFVRALKGFPGPYSSYVYRTIGFNGILKLMSDIPDRYAQFHSKVVYCAPDISLKCFQGVAEGKISNEAQGASGFGFDPIFQPLKGSTKTFGEMSAEEKSRFSHRAHALRVFAEWYRSYCRQSF